MNQADAVLVRGNIPGGFNLAVGEPYFLQEVYGPLYPKTFDGQAAYPPFKGEPDLITLLKAKTNGQHVVVTNGAKQALLAACHALQIQRDGDVNEPYSIQNLCHERPYWPSYPTIADLSCLGFVTSPGSASLNVVTVPNNPDGRLSYDPSVRYDILDAAYASPIYGWDFQLPYHKISVWSAAKLFGVSGYRIGWLATGDAQLAQLAAEYVEKTTSGVSMPSQVFLRNLLCNIEEQKQKSDWDLEAAAYSLLHSTNGEFLQLAPFFEQMKGFCETYTGMFAWVKAKDPAGFRLLLDSAKVKAVDGKFCGGKDGWFRFSLGVLPETMRRAVKAVQEASDG